MSRHSQLVVCTLDPLGVVGAFKPPDDEVAAGHVLKMVHKDAVDQCSTNGPNHGHRLGRKFLRHGDSEARRHLCQEPDERGSTLLGHTLLGQVLRASDTARAKLARIAK